MLFANSLHILCFGDSLTEGMSLGRPHPHPYSIALKSSLEEAFPSFNVTTDNQGVSGDQATSPPGSFLPRMVKAYEETHPHNPYDWAIILGGTNDLSMEYDTKDIYEALQKVWAIPLSHGTKVLALTVPECGFDDSPITVHGDELNKLIMEHKDENYHIFDLHTAIPFRGIPDKKRGELWGDPVHYSPKGYDLVGKLLAERLTGLIQAQSIDGEVQDAEGRTELKKRDLAAG
ncbi:SGNH hydrolase-type esterase domain-containing protein [Hyaloscypha finlandica]|nr:SGNH hydrolase-type esterase domain-containing protein [Hyaloscypha finlandica]